MRKILTVLFILIHASGYSENSKFVFKHFATEKGLSQSTASCIIQDRKGFIWIGTWFGGLNRYDGTNFIIYKYNRANPNGICNNHITWLTEDKTGNIWVGTFNGLSKFDVKSEKFTSYYCVPEDAQTLADNYIYSINEDNDGNIWVATRNAINLYHKQTGKFTRFLNQGFLITEIKNYKNRGFWVNSAEGKIYYFDKQEKIYHPVAFVNNGLGFVDNRFKIMLLEESTNGYWNFNKRLFKLKELNGDLMMEAVLKNLSIRAIVKPEHDQLWLGTSKGLNVFNTKTGKSIIYNKNEKDPGSLNSSSIFSMYLDRSGNLWVGTWASGINLMLNESQRFVHYKHYFQDNESLSIDEAGSFCEDEGGIWIGTEAGGLNFFDLKTKKFASFKSSPIGNVSNIKSICKDSYGKLWLGIYDLGLVLFDRKTKSFGLKLPDRKVYSVIEGEPGCLWIATRSGIYHYNSLTRETARYRQNNLSNSLVRNTVQILFKDRHGQIWIGTTEGLSKYRKETDDFQNFVHKDTDPASLSGNYIVSMGEDLDGNLWIGTNYGLNKYNPANQSFTRYLEKSGLPDLFINGILCDNQNNLWISTNMGISRFNPRTGEIRNYSHGEGLQDNEFNRGSYYKDSKGNMYFGGINGFNIFHPDSISDNPSAPRVFITGLKFYNQTVKVDEKNSPLKESILETKEITLTHRQAASFTLEFAAIDYSFSEKNQYKYIIEGFHDNWVNIGNTRSVTFTNLDPGKYTFRVISSNSDGKWSKESASINIVILPPFWKTWWAYSLYALLIFLILYGLYTYLIKLNELKNDLKLKEIEKIKANELNLLKLQFFTNISHEIRTPLTLLISPIEQLIEEKKGSPESKLYHLMYKNALQLKRLIGQLMDFRKIERGAMPLRLVQSDLMEFIREICQSFTVLSNRSRINFTVHTTPECLNVWFDPDKIEKILYNLLSNAFKYTPEHGHINISADQTTSNVHIKVKDSGVGIPEESQAHIFESFYQANNTYNNISLGTGIGLSLTKELVSLHHGTILLSSKPGEGTEFIVTLPAWNNIPEHLSLGDNVIDHESWSHNPHTVLNGFDEDTDEVVYQMQEVPENKLPTLLIVEDNNDLRSYLKKSFAEQYNPLIAKNGKQGLSIAVEKSPDLIISDVMMPEMDGRTFCRLIKTDISTSHIPVVLLTAQTSIEEQISGLEDGADAYVTKPFNMNYLKALVKNLLDARQRFQKRFIQNTEQQSNEININPIDEKFLTRAIEIIDNFSANPEFDVNQFVSHMGMSRTLVYNKIKAITGMPVHEFIKVQRLKKAASLLLQRKHTITEVSDMVGFADQKHFSTIFKKQFGITPSDYISKHKILS